MAFSENNQTNPNLNLTVPIDEEGMIVDLRHILSYKRRHGHQSTREFVEKFVMSLPEAFVICNPEADEAFAVAVITDKTSKTLFSCHVDSVHHTPGRQVVKYDEGTMMMYIDEGECLGADDGAGVWLMRQMIAANIPGTYLFHYGEECGGIGSSGMADHHEDFLKAYDRAIAFDRGGRSDVITHQAYGRCASDTFAKELSARLNAWGMRMEPSDGGVFTDTANYVSIIPECTNISVGYDRQHGPHETLDVEHLLELRHAVLCIDWETLPTERDPAVRETKSWLLGDDDWYEKYRTTGGNGKKSGGFLYFDAAEEVNTLKTFGFLKMKEWVRNSDIADVAEVLMELVDQLSVAEDNIYDLTMQLEGNYEEDNYITTSDDLPIIEYDPGEDY